LDTKVAFGPWGSNTVQAERNQSKPAPAKVAWRKPTLAKGPMLAAVTAFVGSAGGL